MKYNININQYAIFSNPEFACLTLQDLAVFDFIKDFANTSACKRNSDGYFWIKHTIVSDALPILGVFNEETNTRKDICRAKISQIMRKLCKVGLLAASPDNEVKGISEYGFGANYDKMIFAKDEQKNSNPCKNLQPPYQKNTTPPCKNLQGYNIYKNIIGINDNSSNTSNDVLEQTRANFSENEFADFCNTHQLHNLSKSVLFQNFFLEKEKSCAKKEKYGEAAYIATLQSIEAYISEKPKYLSNKKDFGRIFDNFAISPEVVSLENAFKAAYFERYEVQHANIRKSEESAAKAILAALRGQLKLNDKQEVPPAQIKAFFTATLGLATYNNPMQAKLAFIASSFSQIIAALKAAKEGKSTSAGGNIETFRERDKRLQQQERENRDAKMKAAALYAAQKEQLERFTDNGWAITEEMKMYPAYKDMFGGAPFGSEEAF